MKALGEHWSAGGLAEIESSTFDNVRLSVAAAPAIEFNVFPYSAYTRRQLRALYLVGAKSLRYNELTLFQKTNETLPVHELSLTFEQRERWGTLEARGQWSQYLHQLDKSRFEVEADVSVRVARGLSVGAELNASRIRDQLRRQSDLFVRIDFQQHRQSALRAIAPGLQFPADGIAKTRACRAAVSPRRGSHTASSPAGP